MIDEKKTQKSKDKNKQRVMEAMMEVWQLNDFVEKSFEKGFEIIKKD